MCHFFYRKAIFCLSWPKLKYYRDMIWIYDASYLHLTRFWPFCNRICWTYLWLNYFLLIVQGFKWESILPLWTLWWYFCIMQPIAHCMVILWHLHIIENTCTHIIRPQVCFRANYPCFRETLQWLLHSNIRIGCTVQKI